MVRSVYKMRWALSDRVRFTSGRRFLLLSAIAAVHFAFEVIVSSLTDPMAVVSHLLATVALVGQNSCSVGDLRTIYTRNALIAPSFLPCTSSRAPQKTRAGIHGRDAVGPYDSRLSSRHLPQRRGQQHMVSA